MGGEGIAEKRGDGSAGVNERLIIGAKMGTAFAGISGVGVGAKTGLGAKIGSAIWLGSEIGRGSGSESASELESGRGKERAGITG